MVKLKTENWTGDSPEESAQQVLRSLQKHREMNPRGFAHGSAEAEFAEAVKAFGITRLREIESGAGPRATRGEMEAIARLRFRAGEIRDAHRQVRERDVAAEKNRLKQRAPRS